MADTTGDTARIDPEFTAYPLRDLAGAALERAAQLGAEHADFRAERILAQRVTLSDGTPESLADADEIGLAVRVVAGGTWGFAATVDMTPGAAARCRRSPPSWCSSPRSTCRPRWAPTSGSS